MFRRVITSSAKKTLTRLPKHVQQAILKETEILIDQPFAGERLHGTLSFLYFFILNLKTYSTASRIP